MDDLISRQAAIDAFNTNLNELVVGGEENAKTVENYLNRVLDKIKCLPSALSTNLAEVGTDCISRQAAISAICNACGKIDCDKMDKCEKLQLPPANSSEFPNNSDTISRQAAIEALRNYLVGKNVPCDGTLACRLIENEVINKLPTAQLGTYWKEQCQSYEQTINKLIESLSTQPEIIQCKDCKYWNSGSCECREHAVNCQDYYVGDMETEAEHFCGYAERREVTE